MECTNSSIPLAFDLFETWAEASSLTSFALDATLGTPPQKIVLYPANTQYDVFVYNTSIEYTPPSSLEPFDMEALGYYNSTKSSTYTSTSLKDWNGTQKTYDPTLFDFFQDTLGVGNNLSVDGFPILGSATEEGVQINSLPVSATSVLMKAWKDSGQILSRVVGYWPGTRDNPPANATLVLGGYDAARGNPNLLVTMNLTDSDSEPLANVTKLEYNGPNGAVNLMEGYSDPFTVVFEMYAEHLQFVPQAYENLVKATGATFNASLNRPVYSKRPEGNIVVTLSNNFTTTIPNEEFFIKLPQLYDNGTIGEYPDTYTALIGNITTPGQPMLWGRPYLSMNYIIFDYSRNQMQLTPAQRTLTLNEGTGKQLRPICEPQNTTSPTPTLVTSSSGGGGGSNHAGAIAGGVVGGIVGLALILGLAWSLLRRRRKTKNGNGFHDKPELENTEVAGAAMKKQSVATTVGGELDSGAYAEMDAGQSPKQELDSAVIGSAPLQEMEGDTVQPQKQETHGSRSPPAPSRQAPEPYDEYHTPQEPEPHPAMPSPPAPSPLTPETHQQT